MENDVIMNALLTRRSTRAYLKEAVDRASLEQIVQAGCYAPSASNRQLWHFTVVTKAEQLDQLTAAARTSLLEDGRDVPEDYCCTYNAPALIIVSFPKDYPFLKEDGACALQNIFLAAHALGLGSCWINQFGATCNHSQLRAILTVVGVPQNHDVCGCAAIGHIAQETPFRPRAEDTMHFA